MEMPKGNSSINITEVGNKATGQVRETRSGLDLFYTVHNSTDIEEILKRNLTRPDGCIEK